MDIDDPIPDYAIRLTDAYQMVLSRRVELDALVKNLTWTAEIDDDADVRDEADRIVAIERAERVTERFFRAALADRELKAYVRDPMDSQLLELLNPEDWRPCGVFPGIPSNFVGPYDPSCRGPDSEIRGDRRPVFFIRAEFDAWLEASVGPAPAPCAGKKNRAGAKPTYDWLDVEQYVFIVLDDKGDYDDPDTTDDWKSQNQLAEMVSKYVAAHREDKKGPGETILKQRLPPMVANWRAKKGLVGN